MFVLPGAQVGEQKQHHGGDDDQQVGIGRRTADLAHTAHQRDVRIGTEHVLTVLLHNVGGPCRILRPEVFGTDEEQGQQQGHGAPQSHIPDETSFAPHEEEKGQPDDAVNLDERTDDDEQCGPSFAAFLDHGQRPDDQRRDGDVELLFEAGSVKVVERQPQHQARQHHGHRQLPDGPVEQQRKAHAPQRHAQPRRQHRERGDDKGENRTVMVDIPVFERIGLVKGKRGEQMVEHPAEDQEIVVVLRPGQRLRDADPNRAEHPDGKYHIRVKQPGFQIDEL